MKDICGIWKNAADNQHLPFGLSEHLGAAFTWWAVNKGHDNYGPYKDVPYDGNDPAYRDYYHDNFEHIIDEDDPRWEPAWKRQDGWYTRNEKFHKYWLDVMKELIDIFKPELLYTDGGLPFALAYDPERGGLTPPVTDPLYRYGLEAVSYLYNTSAAKHGSNQAVYLQKDRRPEIYRVGTLDIEKSQLPGIQERPWHTDTCIGNWFYDAKQVYKKPGHIIEMLIDIVSKNGCMLLNILQRPDGSLDDEARYIVEQIASWMPICGEAVFGTRPWRVFGEGKSGVLIDGFREEQVTWTDADWRFTCKGSTVYCFMMQAPANNVAVVRSFVSTEKVRSVKLLGYGPVQWAQNYGTLTVQLPPELPTTYTNCLAVEL
jgi:alpha-L-fucosidase